MLWAALTLALFCGCARVDSARQGGAGAASGNAAAPATTNAAGTPGGEARPAAAEKIVPAGAGQRGESDMGDYEPIPLDRLIGMAWLIVSGEVSQVGENTFTLRPTQTLAGDAPGPQVEVLQFIPSRFEGAPRPAPYKAGQSFLLFLVKDEKRRPQDAWKILGIGGEGEMPIEDGFVYFHARNVEGLSFGTYSVHGTERRIQRFDAQTFLDAVKGYRSCFAWEPGEGKLPQPVRLCDEASLEKYARTSDIHRRLARLTVQRLGNR